MNRRSFLKTSALALFGFSVLPPAKTYERIWKVQRRPIINPAYIDAEYETAFIFSEDAYRTIRWTPVIDPLPPFQFAGPIAIRYRLKDGEFEKVVDASPIQA